SLIQVFTSVQIQHAGPDCIKISSDLPFLSKQLVPLKKRLRDKIITYKLINAQRDSVLASLQDGLFDIQNSQYVSAIFFDDVSVPVQQQELDVLVTHINAAKKYYSEKLSEFVRSDTELSVQDFLLQERQNQKWHAINVTIRASVLERCEAVC